MKKVLLGGVVLITLGLVGSAFAADMPIKAPVVASNTWGGFYLGADLGGIHGTNSTDSFTETGDGNNPGCVFGCFDPVVFAKSSNWGLSGGVFGGYNWQFDPSWVVGVEAVRREAVHFATGGASDPALQSVDGRDLPRSPHGQRPELDGDGARQIGLYHGQRHVLCHRWRRDGQPRFDWTGGRCELQYFQHLDIGKSPEQRLGGGRRPRIDGYGPLAFAR